MWPAAIGPRSWILPVQQREDLKGTRQSLVVPFPSEESEDLPVARRHGLATGRDLVDRIAGSCRPLQRASETDELSREQAVPGARRLHGDVEQKRSSGVHWEAQRLVRERDDVYRLICNDVGEDRAATDKLVK